MNSPEGAGSQQINVFLLAFAQQARATGPVVCGSRASLLDGKTRLRIRAILRAGRYEELLGASPGHSRYPVL